jgi:predicted amidohydrolase
MKVHLSRWVCQDVESNLRRFAAEAQQAVDAGAEIVVFPELFVTGYTRTADPAGLRERFARVSSAAPETLFVFGSISEDRRNRVTVWTEGGEIARYDKVHLFRPNGEHELWRPGDRYVAFRWRDLTFGLVNCNDLRFPEQARALVLEARCDALIVPAWWPWRRDWVWCTLLRARAIENGVWTIGCCIASSVGGDESFAGAGNHVFDPFGEPVRTADDVSYELGLDRRPELIVDSRQEAVDSAIVEVLGDPG